MARFVDAEVLPIIGRHFRDGTFPAHLVPVMTSLAKRDNVKSTLEIARMSPILRLTCR